LALIWNPLNSVDVSDRKTSFNFMKAAMFVIKNRGCSRLWKDGVEFRCLANERWRAAAQNTKTFSHHDKENVLLACFSWRCERDAPWNFKDLAPSPFQSLPKLSPSSKYHERRHQPARLVGFLCDCIVA